MKTVNELFDNVYCINLDRRSDRWERVKKSFNDMGVKLTRFSAVDGNSLDLPEDIHPAWDRDQHHNKYSIACTLSHIELLKQAIDKGEKEILVLEDDAEPCSNFTSLCLDYYSQLPEDYAFCYLGGNNITPPTPTSMVNVCKTSFTKTTVGYIVKLDYIKNNLPLLEENKWLFVIDEIYVHLQRIGDPLYIFNPRILHQFESHSDITGKEANYEVMKDLD